MATLHHDHHGRAVVFLKGAPERVLSLCGPADHDRWQKRIGQEHLLLALTRPGPGAPALLWWKGCP